jgi:hypothetical protein
MLLIALSAVIVATLAPAANIKISGSPTWNIINSQCTFKLSGSIQNLSSDNTYSGRLRMFLWATATPYPAQGVVVAEHTLGVLFAGQQLGGFTATVPANLPKLSGDYYFTITIIEDTTNGVATRDYVAAGLRKLEAGEFVTGTMWTLPNLPVVAPPKKFKQRNRLISTLKATENLSLIPIDFQARTNIKGTLDGKVNVTVGATVTPAKRRYSVRRATYYDKRVRVGNLRLDYAAAAGISIPWHTTYTLFFHSKNSGTYRSVEVLPNGGRTTWGSFTFR